MRNVPSGYVYALSMARPAESTSVTRTRDNTLPDGSTTIPLTGGAAAEVLREAKRRATAHARDRTEDWCTGLLFGVFSRRCPRPEARRTERTARRQYPGLRIERLAPHLPAPVGTTQHRPGGQWRPA